MATLLRALLLVLLLAAPAWAVSIPEAIEVLAPNAVWRTDYIVSDEADGQGPRITFWNTGALGTQPTPAQLAAVTQGQVDAARTGKLRVAAKALMATIEATGKRDRCFADLVRSEVNILRAAAPIPVTSIIRSGTTATATTRWAHGLSNSTVTVHGADVAAYNGAVAITVTGPSTFTYTVAGSPATPAVGSITVYPATAAMAARTNPQLRAAIDSCIDGGAQD